VLIKVVLVDDHAVVRDGLSMLLELQQDIQVCGSFGDAAQAVAFCAGLQPDVAVLDVSLPGLGGIDAARRIHELCADTKILMVSMHSGTEYVAQALNAGADGYIVKESAGAELVEAVRTVDAGKRFLSRKISRSGLEQSLRHTAPADPLERLTARERQVLKLVVEGHSSNDIAAALGLSSRSVDTYRSRLMAKLELDDLASLVKFAVRRGVTSLG
jgi:DNA-binding NarL/FixJ family response regulator